MQQGRKLVRNTQDSVFGGVCSGFASYFGWDPTWVRVATALSVLVFAGTPILIYLILWVVVPTDISVYGPSVWQTTYQQQDWQQKQWQQAQQAGYDQSSAAAYQQQSPYQQDENRGV